MAKINIREQDLSTTSAVLSSENVVYVPGYSKMGPINTPTLCTSYDSFISKFGSSPFVYSADQAVNNIVVENSGGFEKSWIFAAQLLRAGLPVLFERVTKHENILQSVDASGTIAATVQNTATGKIEFKVRSGPGQILVNETTYYTQDDKLYTDSAHSTEVDSLEFNYNIEDGKVLIDFNDRAVGVGEFIILSNNTVIIYGSPFTYDSVENTLTLGGNPVSEVSLSVTVLENSVTVGTGENLPTYRLSGQSLTTDALNYFSLSAKNQGSYGNSLSVSLKDSSTTEKVFVTVSISDGVNSEEFLVSFDKSRTDFIETQLKNSRIIDIVSTLSDDFEITIDGDRTLSGFEDETSIKIVLSNGTDDSYSDTLNKLSSSNSPYDKVSDKMLYDVSFITSGGYPNLKENTLLGSYFSSIGKNMIDSAGFRGDAVAILNFENSIKPENQLSVVQSVFPANSVTDNGESLNSFGAVFSPNITVYCSTTKSDELMPASFVYLRAFANSIKNNSVWFAVSGVKRGLVSEFKNSLYSISQVRMNEWQDDKQSINPIMEIRPSGYCIFGNRTLHFNSDIDNMSLLTFLNVRVLNNYLKKVVRQACLKSTYENNDNVLWNGFKSDISPVLDQIKTGRGVFDYKIIRLATNKKATVAGIVRVQPIEAVEAFDILFSIENSIVNVE